VGWLGSTQSRDFFLSDDEGRQQRFRDQIEQAETASKKPLSTLAEIAPSRFRRLAVQEKLDALIGEMKKLAAISERTGRPVRLLVHETVGARRSEVQIALQSYQQESLNDLNQAQIRFGKEQQRTRERLFVLLAIAVMMGVVIAGVSMRHAAKWDRDRQAYYQQLEEANQRLEFLSARLLDIQEEERGRLSRELHDDVGQTLTALRMEISAAARSPMLDTQNRERLLRARELAERSVQVVRDLSLMLRPSILDDLGLGSAIQWQLEEFSRRSHVSFDFAGQHAGEDLPEALKTCIFRITQEALNNIEKYAHATRVEVVLDHDETAGTLSLSIRDNGRGFESRDGRGRPPRGSGILGMQERVAHLNGEFRIESVPGAGTQVRVVLPAPAPAAEGTLIR
jgi:signal transduction histidine kinase